MNAVLTHSLADWLPADQGPWHLDFEHWPQAQAQRWRAVLAIGAGGAAHGRKMLLAERELDAMLLQSVEARLQAPVRWLRCDPAAITHWLGAGEADFRALSDVEEAVVDGEVAGGAEELTALRLSEQVSPVVRLLNATLYDALQDGASDVHIECTAPRRGDPLPRRWRDGDGAQRRRRLDRRATGVAAEGDVRAGHRRAPPAAGWPLQAEGAGPRGRFPPVHHAQRVRRGMRSCACSTAPASSRRTGTLTLDSLGFDADERAAVRHQARQPHGMLLVTGPTGSGKTTTLYAR